MPDVFIAYSRTDEDAATRLADALQADGISCWMDQQVPGGSTFTDITEDALNEAVHVVVMWSQASVKSNWVKDEAQLGREQGKLVPLTIDGTLPPLGFRQIQSIDFTTWPKDQGPLESLKAVLGSSEAEVSAAATPAAVKSRPTAKRRNMLIAGIAGAALILGGSAYVATKGFPGTSEAVVVERITLAILPFSVSGELEEGDEQLGAGLAGALNSSLSELSGVALTSNTAVAQLTDNGLSMPDIGDQLGLQYLVEGDLNFDGEDMVLTVSLVDAGSTQQIWREQYRSPRAQLPVQANLATGELAEVLRARLGVGEGEIPSSANVDPEAYEAYLRGMQHLLGRHSQENRKMAFDEFSRSTHLDPNFAPAHAGLGTILVVGVAGLDDSLARDEIRELTARSLERALELDPQNLMARVSEQQMAVNDGNFANAIEGLLRIVEEHPDYGFAQSRLGMNLAVVGEHRAALQHRRAALRYDPLNRETFGGYLISLLALGDYDGVRREALDCVDCLTASSVWSQGLFFLTTDQQFPVELEKVRDRWRHLGYPEEQIDAETAIGIAVRAGGPSPIPLSQYPGNILNVIILGEFGEFEAALTMLEEYPTRTLWSRAFVLLLDTPREQWPAAVRADPRYHAKFGHSALQGAITERRKRGHTQNLPVFPVVPYEGP